MKQGELQVVTLTCSDDGSILYIPSRSEFTRIIVSLNRNEKLWLTSLGWQGDDKSVALKCDNTANGLAIYLPKKHAKTIAQGDVVNISCTELAFKASMTWPIANPDLTDNNAPISSTAQAEPRLAPRADYENHKTPGKMKALMGGAAAIAIIGAAAFFTFNKNPSSETSDKTTETVASKPIEATDRLALEKRQEKIKAAREVAALIEAKKNEADRLAAEQNLSQAETSELTDKTAEDTPAGNEDITAATVESANINADIKTATNKIENQSTKKADIPDTDNAETTNPNVNSTNTVDTEKSETITEDSNTGLNERQAELDKILDQASEVTQTIKQETLPDKQTTLPLSSEEIETLQKNLTDIGYYNGNIDGLMTSNTVSAVNLFKSIFDIPQNSTIDRDFLKRVEKERQDFVQKSTETKTLAPTPAPTPITANIATPAPSPVTNTNERIHTPKSVPDTVKPRIKPKSDSEPKQPDIIVEAKRISVSHAQYPARAARRGYYINTDLVVLFDISTSGNVINPRIESSRHIKRFRENFEEEAMKAAQSQRFEPKTINGKPAISENKSTRIIFRSK